MIRNDGIYTIYVIQHRQGKNIWVNSSLDYFGYPKGFTASDKCWQKTGISGTFDFKKAEKGIKDLRRQWPLETFRVACIDIIQRTTGTTL